MPQQRQEPGLTGLVSNKHGNPLRTLLDGLKMVTNAPDDPSVPSQIQPVPQMLIPNNSVLLQGPKNPPQFVSNFVPGHVTFVEDRSQFNESINQIKSQNANFKVVDQQQSNSNIRNVYNNNDGNLNKLPPPSQLQSTFNSPPILNINRGTTVSTNQMSPNQRHFQAQQPRPAFMPNEGQCEMNKITSVFNSSPTMLQQHQLPQLLLGHSQSSPKQPGIFLTSPTPYSISSHHSPIQCNPILQQSCSNIPHSSNNPSYQTVVCPISVNQSHPLPPQPMQNLNNIPNNNQSLVSRSSQNPSQLPSIVSPQGQAPIVNQRQVSVGNSSIPHSAPPLSTINQPRSLSLATSRLQEGDKISGVLNGFKQILQNKPRNTVSIPSSVNDFRAHDQPSQNRVEGSSVCNEEERGNSTKVIPHSAVSTNDEQQLNSEVKNEVIEIDEADDDCLITVVDLSKRIFVLQKEHHGATINLVDDDEDSDKVETEPAVVKTESGEAITVLPVKDKFDNQMKMDDVDNGDHDKEIDDIQIATSSVTDKLPTDIGLFEMKKTIVEQSKTSKVTEENRGKTNATNSFPLPDDKSSEENESVKTKSNESSLNPATNVKHLMSGLGNILHSMKGNERKKLKNVSSETTQTMPTNIERHKNIGNETDSNEMRSVENPLNLPAVSKPNVASSNTKKGVAMTCEGEGNSKIEEKGPNNVKTSLTTKLNVDSMSSPSPVKRKSVSLKFPQKPCSVSLKSGEISIVSLCKKNVEANGLKSSSKNNNFSMQNNLVNEKRKNNDDKVNKNKNSTGKSKAVNLPEKSLKRRKPGPKPGSKRGPKRLNLVEEQCDAASSSHGEDKSSSGRSVIQSLITQTETGKIVSGTNKTKTAKWKENVGNLKSQEVIAKQVNKKTLMSFAQNSVKGSNNGGKEIEKSPIPKNKSSDEADDDSFHDISDEDEDSDDDSDSVSDTSCSSVSDSSDDADVEYLCRLCSKSFSRRSQLKKHMKSHYKGNEKKVEKRVLCKGCRRKFTDVTALQAHLVQRRYCFFDCTRAYWKKKDSSLKACRMCGKGQAKWKDLKKHSYRDLTCRLRFINLVLECIKKRNERQSNDTGERGVSDQLLRENKIVENKNQNKGHVLKDGHKRGKESKTKMSKETELSKTPGQSVTLESSSTYNCGSCGQSFETPLNFREHLNKDDKCKKFYLNPTCKDCPVQLNYCPHCSIFMVSQSKLLTHVCSGISSTVRCNICLKVFGNVTGLKCHLKKMPCGMVTNEDVAEVTKTRVAAPDNISIGNAKHTKESLECIVCKKSFSHIQELLDHSHTHTDEGRYSCQDCNMVFERSNSLVSHMIWHKRKLELDSGKKGVEGAALAIEKKPSASKSSSLTSSSPSSSSSSSSLSRDCGEILQCYRCPLRFKSKIHYKAHISKHMAKQMRQKNGLSLIKNTKKESITFQTDDMNFSCSKCGQRFSTLGGRNEHLNICGKQKQCGKDNNDDNNNAGNDNVDAENITSKKKFKVDPLFKCIICETVIKKKSFYHHLNFHKQYIAIDIKKNAKQPLSAPSKAACVICKKVYSCNKILLRHIMMHKTSDIMTPVKKNQFPSKRQHCHLLKASKTLESKMNSSKSPLSGSQGSVARKIAHKRYSFSCKICDKKFSNIPTFKFHLKISHNHKHSKNEGWSDYVNYMQDTQQQNDKIDEESVGESSVCPTRNKSSISSLSASDLTGKPTAEVMCEICQRVTQRKYRPRHMQIVHGLPRAMFFVRPRKSSGTDNTDIKKEMQTTGCSSNIKESPPPRIEVDMGGANITVSHPKAKSEPSTMNDESGSSKECTICGKSFSHYGLLWKHLFSHITPCWVALMRLEDVIKEVPSEIDDKVETGDGNGAIDIDVDDADDGPHTTVDIQVADEAEMKLND